jgi:exodeoxyribonuclease V beta subunit
LPVGVEIGTFVHRVLQATDFAAPELENELRAQVATALARREINLGDHAAALAGLRSAIETPLGPLLGDISLRDLSRSDRLDELEFELPLVGGDKPTASLTLDAIGAVIREHISQDDPLFSYVERLEDPALRRTVRGYMTGSIDVVARVLDDAGKPHFAVLDYKTNWLGPIEAELTAWHYRPSALTAEMQRAHYWLQALLYTVALHRYLRWRLLDYEPERHLAGVLYLFLRGMVGSETPAFERVPCGVFAWRPPATLVEALSVAFDTGATS